MIKNGFITLYRSLLDWEWYDDLHTTRLFIHLLLTANYEDKQWHGVTIKRGQRAASHSALAKETGLTDRQIRTAVNRLKTTNSLSVKRQGNFTIFSLLNYDKYQTERQTFDKQNVAPATSRRQTDDDNGKKDNKDNNIINNNIPPYDPPTGGKREHREQKAKTDAETALEQGFHQFWAAYPNKKSKNDAKKVWFKLKPDKVLLARILDAVDKQSGTEQWQKENRKFVPYPAKWLRGGCWDDEVEVNTRERYERLDGGEGFIAPDTSNW